MEVVETAKTEEKAETQSTTNLHKFVTFPGNHPEAVRNALIRRGGFIEIPNDPSDEKIFSEADLIWRPVGYNRKSLTVLEEINKKRPIPLVFYQNIIL